MASGTKHKPTLLCIYRRFTLNVCTIIAMNDDFVSVVVPNWNGKPYLKDCLDSLLRQTHKANIIVVDNGSKDGSLELLKESYPEVEVIALDKNYGFAGGVNRGITRALEMKSEYVALFNNDAVADKDWLKQLVITANKHPEVGIVTPKLLKSDKKHLDSTGDWYSVWGLPFPRGRNEVDNGQYEKAEYVMGASGGASLYRSTMLKEIGLFDEAFFAYYEDVDLSLRAQLSGWKVYYQPTALAYHEVGGTSTKLSNFTRFHSVKNINYLFLKNMPLRLFIRYLPRFLLANIFLGAGALKRGKPHVFAWSYLVMLAHVPTMLIQRHRIQSSRKISVGAFDSLLFRGMPPPEKSLRRILGKEHNDG